MRALTAANLKRSEGVRVLIHIVTWNSAESIAGCIERASCQEGFALGETLWIHVTDNASTDSTQSIVSRFVGRGIDMCRNESNLGFCGAHNQAVGFFLEDKFDALLILNPDAGLGPSALREMADRLQAQDRLGLVTPKLLRGLPSLEAIHPHVLDAAGMILTKSCRHFDRGAGEWDQGQFDTGEFVFGGTGACLLISRECVLDLCLPDSISDESVYEIYPQLRAGVASRRSLFDEAFFAYREDADLSWRAKTLGWLCWYEPRAVVTHVRVVTPERRASLPSAINAYSVRNRFLLQLNNWSWSEGIVSFACGVVVRNLMVILGVVLGERSSLRAFSEVARLAPRALSIRGWIRSRLR